MYIGGEGIFCGECLQDSDWDAYADFPCPSLLDVTNQLDLVMGEETPS